MVVGVAPFTRFVMDDLQLIALAIMVCVYALRIRWVLSFRATTERTPARGDERKAIGYALLTFATPWELPAIRLRWVRWTEFAIFHLAIAAAIAVTFILPYRPRAIGAPGVVAVLRVVFLAGAAAAFSRLVRRFARPEMRAISSPDDLFSLALLVVWLVAGVFAVAQQSELWLLAFFGMTAFFLVYVPFSKISHYIYWPFIRYYMGRHLGHRGSYPAKRVVPHA